MTISKERIETMISEWTCYAREVEYVPRDVMLAVLQLALRGLETTGMDEAALVCSCSRDLGDYCPTPDPNCEVHARSRSGQ
jgi:hypothetical protein